MITCPFIEKDVVLCRKDVCEGCVHYENWIKKEEMAVLQ